MPSHFYLEALENPDVYNYITFVDHDDDIFLVLRCLIDTEHVILGEGWFKVC